MKQAEDERIPIRQPMDYEVGPISKIAPPEYPHSPLQSLLVLRERYHPRLVVIPTLRDEIERANQEREEKNRELKMLRKPEVSEWYVYGLGFSSTPVPLASLMQLEEQGKIDAVELIWRQHTIRHTSRERASLDPSGQPIPRNVYIFDKLSKISGGLFTADIRASEQTENVDPMVNFYLAARLALRPVVPTPLYPTLQKLMPISAPGALAELIEAVDPRLDVDFTALQLDGFHSLVTSQGMKTLQDMGYFPRNPTPDQMTELYDRAADWMLLNTLYRVAKIPKTRHIFPFSMELYDPQEYPQPAFLLWVADNLYKYLQVLPGAIRENTQFDPNTIRQHLDSFFGTPERSGLCQRVLGDPKSRDPSSQIIDKMLDRLRPQFNALLQQIAPALNRTRGDASEGRIDSYDRIRQVILDHGGRAPRNEIHYNIKYFKVI